MGQGLDLPFQVADLADPPLVRDVLERAEVVEQGLDPDRRDEHRQEQEGDLQQPQVEPPSPRAAGQQEVRHPGEQERGDRHDPEHLQRVAEPAAEALLRQPVGVLADEPLVVEQGEARQVEQHRVQDDVDPDREEPRPPDPSRQVAEPRRRAREQDDGREGQAPQLVDRPEPVAAPIILQGQRARLGHGHRGPLVGRRGRRTNSLGRRGGWGCRRQPRRPKTGVACGNPSHPVRERRGDERQDQDGCEQQASHERYRRDKGRRP